jgi:hypothetical protein
MSTEMLSNRRRFFWKAGAAMSAVAGVGAARASGTERSRSADLEARLALHDELDAIRELQRELVRRVNDDAAEPLAPLFVDGTGPAVLDDVRRLMPAGLGERDSIEIDEGLRTAEAELQVAVETAAPLTGDATLVKMARAQGHGEVRRIGRARLAVRYEKTGDVWRVRSLELRGFEG